MKTHHLIITALMLAFGSLIFGQGFHGSVIEGQGMDSEIMGKEVKYTVYLPPGYNSSERYYPIVYLLHGYTGNETDWVQFGTLDQIVDRAIGNGEIPPMVIVMPDGENNWYVNSYDGKVRYEDMFVQEFVPFIEGRYRIRNTREFRGIAGLSMGGYGSLILSLRHPDLFTACAPLSAGVVTDRQYIELDQPQYDKMFSWIFGPDLEGEARINDHYKKYAPLQMVANQPADSTARVRYYIDCGDDDWLSPGNAELHILMKNMGIPHEYRVRDGAHDWEYWRTGLVDALKFISVSFTR